MRRSALVALVALTLLVACGGPQGGASAPGQSPCERTCTNMENACEAGCMQQKNSFQTSCSQRCGDDSARCMSSC